MQKCDAPWEINVEVNVRCKVKAKVPHANRGDGWGCSGVGARSSAAFKDTEKHSDMFHIADIVGEKMAKRSQHNM